jgi:ATP-dependent helicase/nuclease subunit B
MEPWHQFLLLAHHADLLILHRVAEEDQPLGASVWVKRLDLLLHRHGRSWAPALGARGSRTLACTPPSRPLPVVGHPGPLWPRHLSAQGYEDLRDCPYRYYARHVLRLREVKELDDDLEPQDLGLWVHAVFQHFHDRRLAERAGGAGSADDDVRRLRQIAQEQAQSMGLLDDDFLPHRLWFDALAEGYVRWLHAVEAEGQHYRGGEMALEARVDELEALGVTLQGRIDRLDVTDEGGALLIDYKTSSAQRLKGRMAEPAEETQLTFYALLYALAQRPREDFEAARSAVRTAYLPLPSRPGEPLQPMHFDAAGANARHLLHAIAHDLSRLARGAPMPALGHETVCERCQARGLCRRDDWPTAAQRGSA